MSHAERSLKTVRDKIDERDAFLKANPYTNDYYAKDENGHYIAKGNSFVYKYLTPKELDAMTKTTSSLFKELSEAEKLFNNSKFYGGTFMVKTNKFTTELPLHQDWNIVNELQDVVYLIWIPIQDVDENNGTLFLIEKSHLLFENYRSGSSPSIRISRQFLPKEKIKTIQLKVGEYLIYNPAIFHGSYKNKQKQERVVATAMVTNTGAALTYYHKIDNNNITAYKLSSSSYLNDITQIANGQVPKNAILLETLQNKITSIDKNMLLNKLNIKYGFKEKISRYINAIIYK